MACIALRTLCNAVMLGAVVVIPASLHLLLLTTAGAAAAGLPCAPDAFAKQNLSGLQMLGDDKLSATNASQDQCRELCCNTTGCTAWNHHLSSLDPSHHPGECWLSSSTAPIVAQPASAIDVWVGGSDVPVTCFGRPCAQPPEPCDGSNYTQCRQQLVRYVFNTTTGALPSRSTPDAVEDWGNWTMQGVPGPGQGANVGNVAWRVGLQKLVWTIGAPGGGMREGMLRLNSTVW
jgi:hypothetical protein